MHLDNCTVRVFSPILTEEEKERRMERIKKRQQTLLCLSKELRKNSFLGGENEVITSKT